MDDLKGKIQGWVDTVLGWLDKFTFLDFSFNADLSTSNSGNGVKPNMRAAGGITLKGKPELAWIGEGGEQEAIIPLSKLPGLMAQMYGPAQAPVSGIVLNINNPVVREEQDIDRIADAVSRKIGKRTANNSRLI